MTRSASLKYMLCLTLIIAALLACDTSSLPFMAPTATPYTGPKQYPTTSYGSADTFRPSPAGWIAFINQGNLWLVHPDGSGLKQVTHNATPAPSSPNADYSLRWSPDGKMLGYAIGGVLTVLDITSLQPTVRANATQGGFDWSGNAGQIVYDGPVTVNAAKKPANNGLWLVDVDSGKTRQLLPSSATYPAMVNPQWSSHSSRVPFSEPDGAKPGGTHLFNLKTGDTTDLVEGSVNGTACSWSPKIMLIACVNANPPSGQLPGILFLNEDGKENLDLALPTGHFQPRLGPWSPDGSKLVILYSADANGTQDMTDILTMESGDLKTFGSGQGTAWSADGRWLVMEGSTSGSDHAVKIVNVTSGISSDLPSGSSMAWQPGSADVSGVPTPSYCMDTAIGFVHLKPKGYTLTFCMGAQHWKYPSLEQGVYAVGPQASYFVYVSNSGDAFAAHMGDPALTRIGQVRNFIAVRTEGMTPRFQIRFFSDHPNIVQIVELNIGEKETFTLPSRIIAPAPTP
ncbi:MAG: hypothetical protein ACM3MF_12250 [Anaerolineae bacterium]